MSRPTDVPRIGEGLTLVRQPAQRSTGFYRLVSATIRAVEGATLWIDARGHAVPRVLYAHAPSKRSLDAVRVARAFTAYQHHSLVHDLPRTATSRTGLIVVPAVADLYRDGDVPDYETERLLESTLAVLSAVADSLDVPVVVTTSRDDDLGAVVTSHADHRVECRETRAGTAYEGEGVRSTGYWHPGWWQTTIPYWVDVLGTAADVQYPAEPVAAHPTLGV